MQSPDTLPSLRARGGAGAPRALLLPALVVLAGSVFRAVPVFTDFWYDEIAAWNVAMGLSGPLDVLSPRLGTANHPAYTLFMWLLGDLDRWEWYRALSVVAGIASLGLLASLGRDLGRRGTVVLLVLGSFCYALIHYASEARGYALAACLALAAFLLARRALDRPAAGIRLSLAFWAACGLGYLSHPAFAIPFLGIAAWFVAARRRSAAGPAAAARDVLRFLGVPALLLPVAMRWYLANVGLGGTPYGSAEIAVDTLRYSFGLHGSGTVIAIAGLALGAALLREIVLLRRSGDPLWVFHLVTVALLPAAAVLYFPPSPFYPRYLLVSVPFALALAGRGLARLDARGPAGRTMCVALLALYCAGNLLHMSEFGSAGRGKYREALAFMADRTRGNEVTLCSSHDVRAVSIVAFYARRMPRGKRFTYVDGAAVREGKRVPEWGILQPSPEETSFPDSVVLPNGIAYRKQREYPSSKLSGFVWVVYRK